MELDPAPAQRSVGTAAGLDRRGQLVVGEAELAGLGTDRQAGQRLRLDRRVEPEQDIEPWRASPDGPSREAAESGRLIRRLDRRPQDGIAAPGCPDHGPQVGLGLADALERDPAVWNACPPGDRPFAARHDVRAQAKLAEPADDGRHVIGLDRVLAQPRVGKGRGELAGRAVARPATSVTISGVPNRLAAARSPSARIGSRSVSLTAAAGVLRRSATGLHEREEPDPQ